MRAQLDLDDVVYGVHAVEEALDEASIQVRFENRSFFAQFPYKAHQSVVALGTPFEYIALDEAIGLPAERGTRLYVVLDHITDPHNAGAIVRSAECAGATAIVLPERRSVGINATVRKAAAGAAAHLPVARVSNIAGALRSMKKAGIWAVGAAALPEAIDFTKADFRRDLALVVGAEGSGISPVVLKECDFLVRIPLHGRIGSLNASVAAGIVLFEALRQRAGAP